MAPAKLHAQFTIDGAAPAVAKLAIDGSLGKVRVALDGQANADPIALRAGDLKLDGKLEADDGKALVAMLGLDRMLAVGRRSRRFDAQEQRAGARRMARRRQVDRRRPRGQRQRHRAAVRGQSCGGVARHDRARRCGAVARSGTAHALPVTFAGNIALDGQGPDAERHRRQRRGRGLARKTRA